MHKLEYPFEEDKGNLEHQQFNVRRGGKRRLGIVPVDLLDKSKDPSVEGVKAEKEYISMESGESIRRSCRRSKLFFAYQVNRGNSRPIAAFYLLFEQTRV